MGVDNFGNAPADPLAWVSYLYSLLDAFKANGGRREGVSLLDGIEGYLIAVTHGLQPLKVPSRASSRVTSRGEWWDLQLSTFLRDVLTRPSRETIQAFQKMATQYQDFMKSPDHKALLKMPL